jgi:hypothetical protein
MHHLTTAKKDLTILLPNEKKLVHLKISGCVISVFFLHLVDFQENMYFLNKVKNGCQTKYEELEMLDL